MSVQNTPASTNQKLSTALANPQESLNTFGLFRDPFFDSFFDSVGFPSSALQWGPHAAAMQQVANRSNTQMQLDVKESDSAFEIQADVPGIAKEDVKVELDSKNVLHVSIDKSTNSDVTDTKDGWTVHRVERSRVSGHRALRLPNTIDSDRVNARVANGVLTVTVPKSAQHEHARRRIDVA